MTRHRSALTESQVAAKWCFQALLKGKHVTADKIKVLADAGVSEDDYASSKTASGVYLKSNEDLATLLALSGAEPPADLAAAYIAVMEDTKNEDAGHSDDDHEEHQGEDAPEDKDDADFNPADDDDVSDDDVSLAELKARRMDFNEQKEKNEKKQKQNGKVANPKKQKQRRNPTVSRKKKGSDNINADNNKDPALGDPEEFLALLESYRKIEVTENPNQ